MQNLTYKSFSLFNLGKITTFWVALTPQEAYFREEFGNKITPPITPLPYLLQNTFSANPN